MRIIQSDSGFSVEVYGIYWAEYQGRLQRFHLVIPEEGYLGFISVPESDCELVDSEFSNFLLIKDSRGKDALVHTVLRKEGLLDRIIDHDPDAVEEFLELIAAKDAQ
ncbi:hypothetical protein EVC62_06530 [Salinicola endophyticus]|uniref:Uncharacterized protein n=1 Tax=Salinicola endophyticus TaxID=1949083 RepID=A0ABY8FMS2_9GAMM|nr:hypothetical protein [Salinicola endophyticus]WFF41184.1 hypothetical protein EVC62_06530 [Salinicola endophyticus]